MDEIIGIYGNGMSGMEEAKAFIQLESSIVVGKDYLQIPPEQEGLVGTLNADIDDWMSQMAYQHIYGYLNVLSLECEMETVQWIFGDGEH